VFGVFVRFVTRGVQKHQKGLLGGSSCQKPFAKTTEGKQIKNFSPVVFSVFPSTFFLSRFWPLAVFLHEELKNTTTRVLFYQTENP
jgi:hypothetical protein